MTTQASTIERTSISDDAGDDHLTHIFCTPCERAAKRRAKKPTPFCGKVKEGPWLDRPVDDSLVCAVCLEVMNAPCSRCGLRSVI